MKYKIEKDLLYELASINIYEIELNRLKLLRQRELIRQAPKEVSGVDYSKEVVQGGLIESEEQQIFNIQCLTAQIFQTEQLINDYKSTLGLKVEQINSVLTERQRYIFEETFIKGRTCEDVANELGVEIKAVIRERKRIVEAISRIKETIKTIKSEIFGQSGM